MPKKKRNNLASKNWSSICIFNEGYIANQLLFKYKNRTKSKEKDH